MTKIEIILLLVVCVLQGFLLGVLFMQNRFGKHYGKEHDRITAGVIHRLYKAMLSLRYDREDIDMVVERMGQKILPPAIPAPTHVLTPKENKKNKENTET